MKSEVLRKPSPNEARCIIRHDLGFYSNLVVGAIYLIPQDAVSQSRLQELGLYAPAMAECIKQHAFLSATIQSAETEGPVFTKPEQLDLRNHFHVLKPEDGNLKDTFASKGETALLARAMEHLHNDEEFRFTNVGTIPAWALDILVLQTENDSKYHRVFISFNYSHSHGDGMSGIAFHNTFYEALQKTLTNNKDLKEFIIKTSATSIPDQADTPSTMPISLSYLLAPALGTYLPGFITSFLGISGSLGGNDEKTWIGSETFIDSKTAGMNVTTSVEMAHISAESLNSLLVVCKKQRTTLTPVLNHLIAEAVCEALKEFCGSVKKEINCVAQIPVNLRKALGVSNSVMGNYPSTAFLRFEYQDASRKVVDESLWQDLREKGQKLASAASNLQNQPVGLLRYVTNLRSWMQNNIGKARDSSWEFSNLGSFDPGNSLITDQGSGKVLIEHVVFSQPASPLSAPLTFNVIGMKNGGLSVGVSWQIGSLDLPPVDNESKEEREYKFVELSLKILSKQVVQIGQLP